MEVDRNLSSLDMILAYFRLTSGLMSGTCEFCQQSCLFRICCCNSTSGMMVNMVQFESCLNNLWRLNDSSVADDGKIVISFEWDTLL